MRKLSFGLSVFVGMFYAMAVVATPTDTLTTLRSFRHNQGSLGTFVQGLDGRFYDTTGLGGANGGGTVFKITPGGVLTTLYSFCAQPNCADGEFPEAGLVQATNGNFYGTTGESAGISNGTVFKITPGGVLTTLYSFCAQPNCTDGQDPHAGLVQATNGNFYGTTLGGGANRLGTVFKITPGGMLTTLYSFCAQPNCTDGRFPYAGLVQATNGNFYGTTTAGGANIDGGTVFKITPGGALTTLHRFCSQSNCTDGENPGTAGLLQATNGNFYGTTLEGGAYGHGMVFGLATGLRRFVATLPNSGQVGAAVRILGNNLTGATSVTFNGVPASFTVVSDTNLATTVPGDATTGKVVVTTPSGSLTSNVNFRVAPTLTSFLPTSGAVGTSVVLTGVKFTGATHVSFNGVQATSFTVDSDTQITVTVPSGASSGRIGVITPGGRDLSSESFTVVM